MYSVGYTEGKELDDTRANWRENRPRPLVWAAWYPCDAEPEEMTEATTSTNTALFRMEAVAKNADLSNQKSKFPVVLLSHGTGGSAQSLCWLGTKLAAQGFICIAVSHHGNCSIEPYLPEGFVCWWERARDLSLILDKLSLKGPFADRLDLSDVTAAGFSLGGYTVLSLLGAITNYDLFKGWLASKHQKNTGPKEFPNLSQAIPGLMENSEKFRQSMERQGLSYQDHRIKAAVVFAPAPTVRAFEPSSLNSITIPVGIMVGQDDQEAPHQDCAVWLKEQCPDMSIELLGETVGHYVFLPEATELGLETEPDICCDPLEVSRRAIHNQATEFVLKTISNH